ncbi:hypothetical protein, partial [Thiocapsa sp.]|uniref:hypothetical protein n=1 Tax=Thiocapsa sp. TaxID=2024551 RepID=UPI00359359AA
MDSFRNLDPATEAHWQTWLDWAAKQGLDLPDGPAFAEARARVWEASDYVAVSVARHPEVLADLIASGELEQAHDAAGLARRFEAALRPV